MVECTLILSSWTISSYTSLRNDSRCRIELPLPPVKSCYLLTISWGVGSSCVDTASIRNKADFHRIWPDILEHRKILWYRTLAHQRFSQFLRAGKDQKPKLISSSPSSNNFVRQRNSDEIHSLVWWGPDSHKDTTTRKQVHLLLSDRCIDGIEHDRDQ